MDHLEAELGLQRAHHRGRNSRSTSRHTNANVHLHIVRRATVDVHATEYRGPVGKLHERARPICQPMISIRDVRFQVA